MGKASTAVTTPQLTLRPTTSSASRRYERANRVERRHQTIWTGPFAEACDASKPPYLAQSWISHVHPEGQRYFHRNQNPRMVTEAYMFREDLADRISLFAKLVEDLVLRRNRPLADSMEVFLELDDSPDSCAYYVVDHATRRLFWFEEVSTEDLGLPTVASSSHFDLCSEELYWTHVEYFPMHIEVPFSIVDDLIRVLGHGRIDRMTSMCSTFPYPADECAKFIDMLQRAPCAAAVDGATVCAAARLWGVVMNHRFLAFAGQENVRLSRDQAIVSPAVARTHWLFSLASAATLGGSEQQMDALDNLYVDQILYADQWAAFVPKRIDEWRTSALWAFGTLIASLLLPAGNLALAAILLSGASIAASAYLLHWHQPLADAPTADAANYMGDALSETRGFLARATVMALPRALGFWALALCMAQIVFKALPAGITLPDAISFPPRYVVPALFLVVCALVVVRRTFISRYRNEKSEEAMV